MPPNKRRDRARSNHLLDVSRGKSKPTGPDTQLLDHEQTPLSIIGRSRVVLDAEEYERLQDAAERNTLQTTAAAEDPADRALRRRADTVAREPERETPPVGESLERFVANIDQDTSTALEAGDTDQVGDQDPFEEFARLRRPEISTVPVRPGSAALAAATTTSGRTRPSRSGNGDPGARRLGRRWWAVILVLCAALAAISVVISERHHDPPSQPVAAQPAARSGSLENLTATRAALTQSVDAAIDKQRRADATRARARQVREARAERSARARRRRLDLRRARQRAAASSVRHEASGTTSSLQATSGTSEATATSSSTPTAPESTTPAAGASSGTTSTTTHTHPFGVGGILGAGHQG